MATLYPWKIPSVEISEYLLQYNGDPENIKLELRPESNNQEASSLHQNSDTGMQFLYEDIWSTG